MTAQSLLRSRAAKPVVFAASLAPLALLAWEGFTGDLTANPIEYITHFTGDWGMRFLLITLAITPFRRLFGLLDLIRFRRMLGLFAFTYILLHFLTWMCLDKFFDLQEMGADILKRRFITMGMLGFVLLIPLAITSTNGWIRRLGRNWQRLHRVIYVIAAAGVIHYYWLVKSDIRLPLLYGVLLGILLLLRLFLRRRPATRPASTLAPEVRPT